MNKILEDILWSIHDQAEHRVGRRGDIRFFILNDILKDVHNFTGKQLRQAVVDLQKQKLIEQKIVKRKKYENSVLISLTEKGMLRIVNYKFRKLAQKKGQWDGKWRMVAFDIPDECRKGRRALSHRMKIGGFYKLQESVFLFPYDCKNEIDAVIKLFKLEKYVRFGLLEFIDNQEKIKFSFGIK